MVELNIVLRPDEDHKYKEPTAYSALQVPPIQATWPSLASGNRVVMECA